MCIDYLNQKLFFVSDSYLLAFMKLWDKRLFSIRNSLCSFSSALFSHSGDIFHMTSEQIPFLFQLHICALCRLRYDVNVHVMIYFCWNEINKRRIDLYKMKNQEENIVYPSFLLHLEDSLIIASFELDELFLLSVRRLNYPAWHFGRPDVWRERSLREKLIWTGPVRALFPQHITLHMSFASLIELFRHSEWTIKRFYRNWSWQEQTQLWIMFSFRQKSFTWISMHTCSIVFRSIS